jgi:hypothetical protein
VRNHSEKIAKKRLATTRQQMKPTTVEVAASEEVPLARRRETGRPEDWKTGEPQNQKIA